MIETQMKSVAIKPRHAAPSALSPDELALAQQSKNVLAGHADKLGRLTFQVRQGSSQKSVVIPATAARLFTDILEQLSEGNTVTVLPHQVELTTQQAAELLNVSRPYLIGLLDGGKIPCRKVGTHRRIYAKDVIVYKRSIDAKRSRALDELAKQAQELNMGY
jgi:excisionase family DNA binding protein